MTKGHISMSFKAVFKACHRLSKILALDLTKVSSCPIGYMLIMPDYCKIINVITIIL